MPVKWRVRARMRDFRSSRALLSGEAEGQGTQHRHGMRQPLMGPQGAAFLAAIADVSKVPEVPSPC